MPSVMSYLSSAVPRLAVRKFILPHKTECGLSESFSHYPHLCRFAAVIWIDNFRMYHLQAHVDLAHRFPIIYTAMVIYHLDVSPLFQDYKIIISRCNRWSRIWHFDHSYYSSCDLHSAGGTRGRIFRTSFASFPTVEPF